jgi:hypothetical protein
MSKHVAEMDVVTSLRERAAATIAALGGAIPARNGQHRPTPPPRMDPHEARVASAHGHTEASWLALTDQQRADARATYTKAPRYIA